MKILIIGSGGREHTITWACSKSKLHPEIHILPGNGGTSGLGKNVNINPDSISEIVDYVKREDFDLTVVGPEAPLVAGITDILNDAGFKVFGPRKHAALIEGSKSFSKKLMSDCGLPTAKYRVFNAITDAHKYLDANPGSYVVKASGLAAGKGVLLCKDENEARKVAKGMLIEGTFGDAGKEIIIEEFMTGREMSLLIITDGEDFILLPPSRDHKKAYDGDKGPNTGGMGAFTPLDDVDDEFIENAARSIFSPVLKHLKDSGSPYKGCLYAGIMLTEDGLRVLEFNCRFGDPEAQVVLPLLNIDLLEYMIATAEGNLKHLIERDNPDPLNWRGICQNKYAVGIVAAAKGYPGAYEKGMEISGIPENSYESLVFHAGTANKEGKIISTGGRVLVVSVLSESLDSALEKAYAQLGKIKYKGISFRTDIGTQYFS